MDWPTAEYAAKVFTVIGGAVAIAYSGIKHVWPCGKRCAHVTKCAWNRVKIVWAAFEDLPTTQGLVAEQALAITNLRAMAVRCNEAVITDTPGSLKHQISMLYDQGESRGLILVEQGEQLGKLDKKVAVIGNIQRAMLSTNPHMATFEADSQGLWAHANRTYFKWSGQQVLDARRWGWLNAVHPEDRIRVRREWESCISDTRRFEMRYRMINITTNITFLVDCEADPIPEGMTPPDRWFGTINQVQTGDVH
jgi:hypothetical protein